MLLDTTLLIDFLRGKKEAIEILDKSATGILFTTEINVFELIVGAYIIEKNTKEHIEKVHALLSRLSVLNIDRNAAIESGKIAARLIKEGKRIEETDCLIAGTAIANGIKAIATRNKEHFERISEIKVISY